MGSVRDRNEGFGRCVGLGSLTSLCLVATRVMALLMLMARTMRLPISSFISSVACSAAAALPAARYRSGYRRNGNGIQGA